MDSAQYGQWIIVHVVDWLLAKQVVSVMSCFSDFCFYHLVRKDMDVNEHEILFRVRVRVRVFKATFNNISVISLRSALLWRKLAWSTRKKLTTLVVIGTDCIDSCIFNITQIHVNELCFYCDVYIFIYSSLFWSSNTDDQDIQWHWGC